MKAETTRRGLLLGTCALVAGCGTVTRLRQGPGFAVVNERLVVRGTVIRRTPKVFTEVLDQNPQVSIIILQDMRGPHDADAARAIGYAIRSRGLDTALQSDTEIYGGAVDLFLGGVARRMVAGAQIGLATALPSDPQRAYLGEMLGRDGFYEFGLRSSATGGIHIMTEEEIMQYGLLTAPIQRFE